MKKNFDNQEFFTAANELLKRGESISFLVKGNSMKPFFKNQETEVYIKTKSEYLPKDICLFQINNVYILHRLIRIKKDHYFFRGDNSYNFEIVHQEDILAYVYQYKTKKLIKTASLIYKLRVRLYLMFKGAKMFVRRIYLGVKGGKQV